MCAPSSAHHSYLPPRRSGRGAQARAALESLTRVVKRFAPAPAALLATLANLIGGDSRSGSAASRPLLFLWPWRRSRRTGIGGGGAIEERAVRDARDPAVLRLGRSPCHVFPLQKLPTVLLRPVGILARAPSAPARVSGLKRAEFLRRPVPVPSRAPDRRFSARPPCLPARPFRPLINVLVSEGPRQHHHEPLAGGLQLVQVKKD